MSSTSTNKQPCLIDRPFLRGGRINSATTTVDPSNPNFSDLVQLVRVGDLPSEDGAFVEDIFLVSNEFYPTNAGRRTAELGLYIYAPNQSAPATSAPLVITRAEFVLESGTAGLIQHFELPAVNAPVPAVGDATGLTRPIEIGKGEGLYLEKGYILCAGYIGAGRTAASGGLSPSGLSLFAQGGFY